MMVGGHTAGGQGVTVPVGVSVAGHGGHGCVGVGVGVHGVPSEPTHGVGVVVKVGDLC